MGDFKDFIETVKDAVSIEKVVEESGAEFALGTRRGSYVCGREHDSLVVYVNQGRYQWFSRGEGGDVIQWLMCRQGWDFMQALEYLARRAGMEIPKPEGGDEARFAAVRQREDVWGVAAVVMQRWLLADEEALGYALERGFSEETVRTAGLGFTGRHEGRYDEMREAMIAAGVDVASAAAVAVLGYAGDVAAWGARQGVEVAEQWVYRKRISGFISHKRLVFPHWWRGRVTYFSARNILGDEVWQDGQVHKSHNLPALLAGKSRLFFNQCYQARADEVVLVEGAADAVALGQLGMAAVAVLGLKRIDDHLVERLAGHEVVYLGMDSDEAGQGGILEKARMFGAMTRLVRWDEGGAGGEGVKDANDFLKAVGELEEADQRGRLRGLLDGSLTCVERYAAWAGSLQGAQRDRAQEEAMAVISQMGEVRLSQYRKHLAKLLGIGEREFDRILKVIASKSGGGAGEYTLTWTLGEYVEVEEGEGGYLIEYVYDSERKKAGLVWREPDGRVRSGDHVDVGDRRYLAEPADAFVRGGGVLMPSALGDKKGTKELVTIVELFIKRVYLLDDVKQARIMAYYVLLTWLYDAFEAIPYLRAMGEAGAGKSELMKRVGYLCYRMMAASGAATASSLFRTVERYKGTVFIDEMDLHDGGDMTNDVVKFLNTGAMKGNPIWRLDEVTGPDGKREFRPSLYATFCPKLLAMRRDFKDDAVGTRSITFKLMPREPMELKASGVRLVIDSEFKRQALAIRNLLLRWRMERWQPEIRIDEEDIDMEISSRLNQVTTPLLALAQDDPVLKAEIRDFLRAYNAEIVLTRAMGIGARVVEALWKIFKYADLRMLYVLEEDGVELVKMGSVSKIANEIIDMMNDESQDDEEEDGKRRRQGKRLTPRGVGSIIRNELQLRVDPKRRTDGYYVVWDDLKMRALAKRYGVDVEGIGSKDVDKKAPGTGEQGVLL